MSGDGGKLGKRPPELDRAKELTAQALHAAMREDWPAATRAMQAVSDETGGEGIYWALRMLCDTAIDAQGLTGREGAVFRPGWVDVSTGKVQLDADAVPVHHRWAARLVTARAAMDKDAYDALLAGMPGDARERGEYAGALLTGTALALRQAMGGDPS